MLELAAIDAGYGKLQVLHAVSLLARAGEIHCVMGRNGAGKTTLLRTIMGLVPPSSGTIKLDGEPLNTLPAQDIPKRRIGYVPQGRRLFGEMSVAENIEIGLMTCGNGATTRERVLDLFPRLRERLAQRAETLSGGEQQMLATARALCLEPRVLLLDEPTEGLQPTMIDAIRDVILRQRDAGVAVVLVEQRVDAALKLADRVTFLENGRNLETLSGEELRAAPAILRRRLGV